MQLKIKNGVVELSGEPILKSVTAVLPLLDETVAEKPPF